jgi:RNA-directed DNA polymerase
VKDRQKEAEPASVTVSKQAGDTQRSEKWGWVEPSVWTDRMLAALEDGVKGGKWYSLMDKVYTRSNFESAWQKVKNNRGAAGVDEQSILKFEKKLSP